MPIAQPPSITEHDRALPLFADRLAERRLFLRYLHTEPPPEQMLFFHGDGGNGKSLLLKLLLTGYCRRLPAADWARLDAIADDRACVTGYDALARSADGSVAVPCVYHDLAGLGSAEDDPRGYWSGPLMIGRALGARGLKLPLFDYALMLYLRGRGQLSAERIKALFPAAEADFAGTLFDLINDTPVAGLAVKVIGLFDKHLKTDFALWRTGLKLDEARLQALQAMAATDQGARLGDALPRLLGESIDAAMQLPGAPPRLVLLIDTHESFWGTGRHTESTATYFERDEWLRALLAQLYLPNHGVIVALAGREPPRWADALDCPIPGDLIDTQLIGHLDPPDADDYLTRALSHEPGRERTGDPDRALRAALIRYTQIAPDQVHPLYLGLAADLCLSARERGERLTAADFPPGPAGTRRDPGRELVTRLLRYCTGEVQSAVTQLAAARGFDRALYFALGDRLRFDSSAADFATLTGFSFVWRDPARPERYRIHDLLRRLIAGLEPERTGEAHAALEAIYRGRGEGDPEAVAEAIYHANRQDWMRGANEWIEVMDGALANARYALGDALAALRSALRLETPYAAGAVARRIGELAGARSRHGTAQGAFREALASLDEALEQASDEVAAYNEKGLVLWRLGELRAALSDHAGAELAFAQAIAAYGEALTRAPDYVDAHINKGSALARLGELRAALSDHAGAESVYTQSIAAYSEALTRAPDQVMAHTNKGNALRLLGELRAALSDHAGAELAFAQAIAAYGEALTRAPDQVAAHINKGNALVRLGELRAALSDQAGAEAAYTQAIAAYGEALTRAPDYVDAHNNKGVALMSLGELRAALSDHAGAEAAYTQAIAAYGEALTRAPDQGAAHMNNGNALLSLGELRAALSDHAGAKVAFAQAIAAYGEALTRAPDYVGAHMNKGNALLSLGELRAALSDHAGAEAAYAQAIAAYGEALTRAPDDVVAHINKGNALSSVGDLHVTLGDQARAESAYCAAIAATNEALRRAPNDVIALGNHGELLRKLADLEHQRGNASAACARLREAKSLLERALTLAPNHPEIAAESARVADLLRSQCPPP